MEDTLEMPTDLPITSGILVELQDQVPELLAALPPSSWDDIEHASQAQFCEWQFERLLNGAADLLDRALEQRSVLTALLASDMRLRQELQLSRLQVNQDVARTKLDGDPNAVPVAYTDIPAQRMAAMSAIVPQVLQDFINQEAQIRFLADTSDLVRKANANADFHALQAMKNQFVASTTNHKREVDAETEDNDRHREVVKLARQHLEVRENAASGGGVLDLRHEAKIVARGLLRDYREAMIRLAAAQSGMSSILGLGSKFRTDKSLRVIDAIPAASELVRNLIHWHSVATQYDQGFTLVIELRDYCTDAQWDDFIDGKELAFTIDSRYFAEWWLPRLRGVAATYSGNATRALRLVVSVPKLANRSDLKVINQSRIPSCVLGRVDNANSFREVEVNGGVTLMNVCPIQAAGHAWKVITQQFGPMISNTGARVEGIRLELTCVGIPVSNVPTWSAEANL